jgi:trans-aconitate methyltransferase
MTESDIPLQQKWSAYYQATAAPQSPHDTLREAMAHFAAERSPLQQHAAVDLGCGTGRDTVELLRRGWCVLAVDNQSEALARIRANVPTAHQEALETRLARFEDIELPAVDLVNASYSLPFCHSEDLLLSAPGAPGAQNYCRNHHHIIEELIQRLNQ